MPTLTANKSLNARSESPSPSPSPFGPFFYDPSCIENTFDKEEEDLRNVEVSDGEASENESEETTDQIVKTILSTLEVRPASSVQSAPEDLSVKKAVEEPSLKKRVSIT
jgi:hypothetical protein